MKTWHSDEPLYHPKPTRAVIAVEQTPCFPIPFSKTLIKGNDLRSFIISVFLYTISTPLSIANWHNFKRRGSAYAKDVRSQFADFARGVIEFQPKELAFTILENAVAHRESPEVRWLSSLYDISYTQAGRG